PVIGLAGPVLLPSQPAASIVTSRSSKWATSGFVGETPSGISSTVTWPLMSAVQGSRSGKRGPNRIVISWSPATSIACGALGQLPLPHETTARYSPPLTQAIVGSNGAASGGGWTADDGAAVSSGACSSRGDEVSDSGDGA